MSPTDAHPLLTIFQRIYVINLAHREDRRREMEAELRRIGLSLDHPAVVLFPASFPPDAGPFPSRGARGCFESHLGVHRRILADRLDSAMVLEDDASFPADFAARLGAVAERLRGGDWAMLSSVAPLAPAPGDDDLGGGLIRLATGRGISTTHCLGFRRGFSERAVDYLAAMAARPGGSPEGGPMHVDGAYGWLRRDHPDLETWATAEPLAVQRPSRSDIAALKFYDRLPVLRDLARLARRLKG